MSPTQKLRSAGQSIWLDGLTRELLVSGALARYVAELSVTGVLSSARALARGIDRGTLYDPTIRQCAAAGIRAERAVFEMALEDATDAADLLRSLYERTAGVDGWVSIEIPSRLACHASAMLASAAELHARAQCPNLLVSLPGTAEGLVAAEEAIFAGIPVNVAPLFSPEQCLAAAAAYLRGIERRVALGLNPDVASVASLLVNRWDVAASGGVPPRLANTLGLAIAESAYEGYVHLLTSPRWLRAFNAGARPQRLVFAGTCAPDPAVTDVFYAQGLVAPLTINAMPEFTLAAFADHGELGTELSSDGDCEGVLFEFEEAGVAIGALAERLQVREAALLAESWSDLLRFIAAKEVALADVRARLNSLP